MIPIAIGIAIQFGPERLFTSARNHYSHRRNAYSVRPEYAIGKTVRISDFEKDVGGLGGSFAEAAHGAIGRPER
jgi:hypothetical protein